LFHAVTSEGGRMETVPDDESLLCDEASAASGDVDILPLDLNYVRPPSQSKPSQSASLVPRRPRPGCAVCRVPHVTRMCSIDETFAHMALLSTTFRC